MPETVDFRRREMTALASGSALMNAGMAASSAACTILTADHLGVAWSGTPAASAIAGTGVGALALTRLIVRHGRRVGLGVGYAIAACGGLVAVAGALRLDTIVLCIAMFAIGIGNAGAQLSRYGAAQLYPPRQRGAAIAGLVWAAALGAVSGPLLLAPAGSIAVGMGWPPAAGALPFAAAAGAAALFATLGLHRPATDTTPGAVSVSRMLRVPATRSALAVMATGQVAMVTVMTATPVHMHMQGYGLASVGLMLSGHTCGMFALSPLTGRLVDRFGAQPVMIAGLATLVIACSVTAVGTGFSSALSAGALFLLGYAWNLCFVSGSARLATKVPQDQQAAVEGAVDAAVWATAAIAAIASTLVLAVSDYALVAILAALLITVPTAVLAAERRAAEAVRRRQSRSTFIRRMLR